MKIILKPPLSAFAVAVLTLVAQSAQAQNLDPRRELPELNKPVATAAATRPWEFVVDTRAVGTDNFYFTAADRQSGVLLQVAPTAVYSAAKGPLQLRGRARGDFAFATLNDNNDGYSDYGLGGEMLFNPAVRHVFRLSGELQRGHDAFGLGRTEGNRNIDRALDLWQQGDAKASYRFGAPGAPAQAEVHAQGLRRVYRNNREDTQLLDQTSSGWGWEVAYNHSPYLAMLLSYDSLDRNLRETESAPATRDTRENLVLVGVRWLTSSKTSGDIRVGYRQRDPQGSSPSNNQFAYRARVQWDATPRDQFTLRTGIGTEGSYLDGVRYIDSRDVQLDWLRSWSGRMQTRARVAAVEAEFVGSERKDRSTDVAVRAEYRYAARWRVNGELRHLKRKSDAAELDGKTSVVSVGLRYEY